VQHLFRLEFLPQHGNVILLGGVGVGKTHLAIAIARSCIRGGVRGRYFNVADLVNRLEQIPLIPVHIQWR
jgi:DNA replication protein DnaC